jgi:hypothetical protein
VTPYQVSLASCADGAAAAAAAAGRRRGLLQSSTTAITFTVTFARDTSAGAPLPSALAGAVRTNVAGL